jgi:nucleoid-associated protein YgaU
VIFSWGQTWLFKAVITSITQKFTMFIADGTPVRATLNVTFRQVEDEGALAKQNPTSGGTGGERLWTVNEGDTLSWIAYQELGDTSRWREIADANRLTRVRRLRPGTMLVIPNG